MNSFALVFFVLNGIGLMVLPRRWAALPLLIVACYMTLAQGIVIGPFRFPILRLLLLVGLIRVVIRRERPHGGLNRMDWLLLCWAFWALISSLFHEYPSEALIFRLGLVYNISGIYFLIRTFCQTERDVVHLIVVTAIVLVPVGMEMVLEQITHRNMFAVFGGVPEFVKIRGTRLRAQGPFAHPILAGTVGAVCLPLMIGIWGKHPRIAKIGVGVCLLIVLASASSGPLLSVIFASVAIALWSWRHLTRRMRIAAVVGYIILEVVMKAPAYYLVARIDLAGGSTGWHRAKLIESAIEHWREWWIAGTDYTRHWMPTGVSWSTDHADITNYYIKMGVIGGLPLMLLFVLIVGSGFSFVGWTLRAVGGGPTEGQFLVWSLGASLFAHAASCTSVSYFDQSFIFLYLNLALISSVRQALLAESGTIPVNTDSCYSDAEPAEGVTRLDETHEERLA